MNSTEKILQELNTEDKNNKLNNWLQEYIEKQNIKNNEIKKMMSSSDYINWLTNFTIDKDAFSDNDWLYNSSTIKKEDLDNIEKLYLFYEGIDKYARNNYIYPIPCEYGNFYKIKWNEIGFEIGVLMGQGTLFFCRKLLVKENHEFIDYNDIILNKKQKQVEYIESCLNSISDMILTAYKNGVPADAIKTTLDNTIQEINSKEEENNKKLLLS